jgi:hypothetical protein
MRKRVRRPNLPDPQAKLRRLMERSKVDTDQEFISVWFSILGRIVGQTIEHWSVTERAKGSFTVVSCSPDHIGIVSPTITRIRRVSKTEFARIFWMWDDYIKGAVSKGELARLSRNSTYVISILHWEKGNPK